MTLSKIVPKWLVGCLLALLASAVELQAQPIRLHPQNPHYFLFRGQPTVLIGNGEHYGSVMNLDFNYVAYLDHLYSKGMNVTRLFTGSYLEYDGFGGMRAVQNTLAPSRLVVPWARSSSPGYAGGGNKFNLNAWDPNYFARLHDFIQQAGARGIVVEVVLFSQMYESDGVWSMSPLNAGSNVNGVGSGSRNNFLTLDDPALVARQTALTRKIVQELNSYDNVYYEVANEPDTIVDQRGVDWHNRIIQEIVSAELGSPAHMIAVNYYSDYAIRRMNPAVSINNGHYKAFYEWVGSMQLLDNYYPTDKALAFDESWPSFFYGSQTSDGSRVEAWEFLVGGGAVYDGLTLAYTTASPTGQAGNDTFLNQLWALKNFMHGFNFLRMSPQKWLVSGVPSDAQYRVLAEVGSQYAIYLHHGQDGHFYDLMYGIFPGVHQANLAVDLPAGDYQAQWVNPSTGSVSATQNFSHNGGSRTLSSPIYSVDIALSIRATGGGSGGTDPDPSETIPPSEPTGGTLVMNLLLNEGGGTTVADASGHGNHGSVLNGPTWTTGNGPALKFDGIDDSVYVNNSSSINSVRNAVTVAAWVYRNSSPGGFQSVISREVGDTDFEHYYLGFENGRYRWFVNTTNGYSYINAGSAAPVGRWVHLVGTYDGANVRLYVNGVLDFATAKSGTIRTDFTGVTIGARHTSAAHTPTEVLNGSIDDARIYDYALSAADVAELYQMYESSGGGDSALKVDLPLSEGSGTFAADGSGNGNHGSLLNGPTWTTGHGPALNFDGVNDTLYVNNSSSVNSVRNGVTVAAWVYRNTDQIGGQSVVSRQLGNTYFEHYYFGFENGRYRWFVNTSNGYSNATVGSAAPLRRWVYMVGTYDGANVRLYVNGVLDFTTAKSGTFPSDFTGIAIGASHNDAAHTPDEAFNGSIDEVRVYDRALTASEISQLYQSTGGN